MLFSIKNVFRMLIKKYCDRITFDLLSMSASSYHRNKITLSKRSCYTLILQEGAQPDFFLNNALIFVSFIYFFTNNYYIFMRNLILQPLLMFSNWCDSLILFGVKLSFFRKMISHYILIAHSNSIHYIVNTYILQIKT